MPDAPGSPLSGAETRRLSAHADDSPQTALVARLVAPACGTVAGMSSPFLYFADERLSPAELSAARLDGHLVDLGEA